LGSGCDASVNPVNSPGTVSQSSVATVPSASDAPTATVPTIAPPTVAATPVPAAPSAIGLPNRRLTPGATNSAVTSATIGRTICVSGWSSRVRPPESYTEPLKIKQIVQYGYRDQKLGDYEEDHLIPISLGGALRDPHNLWPEPHHIKRADGLDVGSLAKDGLEDHLHAAVCAGRISLATAQHEFATNWVAAWIADGRP
ncbi:MAG: hypothetical protein ACRDGQ_00015, partial [Candidatus Limnocylindrales bacterium]